MLMSQNLFTYTKEMEQKSRRYRKRSQVYSAVKLHWSTPMKFYIKLLNIKYILNMLGDIVKF